MSHLMHIRQRIKTIETIKKITHAMRLISMSSHSRLRSNHEYLIAYVSEIIRLISTIQPYIVHDTQFSLTNPRGKPLVITVGSQKGLSGNFNNTLINAFLAHINTYSRNHQPALIVVGKQVVDTIQTSHAELVIQTFKEFTEHNFRSITQHLMDIIMQYPYRFSSVTIVSNRPVNFFTQTSEVLTLLPFTTPEAMTSSSDNAMSYRWYQPSQEIFATLVHLYIKAYIEKALFESLIAEQSARFLSMDAATRNAERLLESTQLEYNKLRQAKITKEIVELSSSF